MRAYSFADWVQPDVPTNGLDGFSGAQEMIVPFRLPEALTRALREEVTSLLFEGSDQGKDVSPLICPLTQEMKMVRHYAVGMNMEEILEALVAKSGDQPVGDHGSGTKCGSLLETECDETVGVA